MKSQRIRITEPGWATYTDQLYGVKFTNGLSDEMVPPSVINQIGTLIRVEGVDDAHQLGAAVELVAAQNAEAPVVAELPRQTGKEAKKAKEPTKPATPVPTYTRVELEAIADKNGIAGLRDIANHYGIKGRGIVELIDEIISAQSRTWSQE